jgi:transcriptional regulator with XRE-family HTH domain
MTNDHDAAPGPEHSDGPKKIYFSEYFLLALKKSGITQEIFAEILGISRQRLNQILCGNIPASKNVMVKLSHQFGFTVNDLSILLKSESGFAFVIFELLLNNMKKKSSKMFHENEKMRDGPEST